MSELSALITSRFNDVSAAKPGKEFSKNEQPKQSVLSLESFTSERSDAFEDVDKNESITWYPAAEFLELESHKAYSFAVPEVFVDAVETDGLKFTQIVDTLTAQLERHMAKANLLVSFNEKIVQFGDEVEELLRVTIGRTQLLLNKRMKQFREQLNRHLNPIPGQKVTKLNDLHGLWALIDMQLEDIRLCFDKIEQCRLRSWAVPPADELSANL
uniref:Uncharacterized protein n=1 Tax=Globodera rostochiensis TaxID=31243 RepID=A0A914GXC6_GLORO